MNKSVLNLATGIFLQQQRTTCIFSLLFKTISALGVYSTAEFKLLEMRYSQTCVNVNVAHFTI